MEHTQQEIINALGVIKNICKEHGLRCPDCPFYKFSNEGSCYINTRTPETWQINDNTGVWRAFR